MFAIRSVTLPFMERTSFVSANRVPTICRVFFSSQVEKEQEVPHQLDEKKIYPGFEHINIEKMSPILRESFEEAYQLAKKRDEIAIIGAPLDTPESFLARIMRSHMNKHS